MDLKVGGQPPYKVQRRRSLVNTPVQLVVVTHITVGFQPSYKVQRRRRRSLKEERVLETN